MTDSELEQNAQVVERIDRAMAWRYGSLGDTVSWKELARLNRWSTTVMHTIRRGERPLKLEEARRIAHRLDYRGGWLFFGEVPERDDQFAAGDRIVERPTTPVAERRREMRVAAPQKRRRDNRN